MTTSSESTIGSPPTGVLCDRLGGHHILICAGSGGVGKTTISAALALGLAQRGKRVLVVTIDPAKRLATALGVEHLGNDPHRITPEHLAAQAIDLTGELWAMTLDSKGTFDALIARLAPDQAARDQVLSNRIYHELSSAVAGSQEFSAIAKLYDLHRSDAFDVIVLDTPPSANAQDFLDAPTRIANFIDGRALAMFLAPTGLLGRGTSLLLSTFARLTGIDLLSDLSTFFAALGSMIDGFRDRVTVVAALLRDPTTAFVVISSPEPRPTREAVLLADKLTASEMARAAVIINRVHDTSLCDHTPEQVRTHLSLSLPDDLSRRLAANLADFDTLSRQDSQMISELATTLGDPTPIVVPYLDYDISDLRGLAEIGLHLFA